jgi:hypothetical protein
MEVLLEAVFSPGPIPGNMTRPTELSVVSTVQFSGAIAMERIELFGE